MLLKSSVEVKKHKIIIMLASFEVSCDINFAFNIVCSIENNKILGQVGCKRDFHVGMYGQKLVATICA